MIWALKSQESHCKALNVVQILMHFGNILFALQQIYNNDEDFQGTDYEHDVAIRLAFHKLENVMIIELSQRNNGPRQKVGTLSWHESFSAILATRRKTTWIQWDNDVWDELNLTRGGVSRWLHTEPRKKKENKQQPTVQTVSRRFYI